MDSGGGLGGGDMGWLGGIGEVIAGEGIMFEGGCIAARRDIALTKGMEGCFMDGAFFFDERIMLDLEDGGGLGLDVFVEEFFGMDFGIIGITEGMLEIFTGILVGACHTEILVGIDIFGGVFLNLIGTTSHAATTLVGKGIVKKLVGLNLALIFMEEITGMIHLDLRRVFLGFYGNKECGIGESTAIHGKKFVFCRFLSHATKGCIDRDGIEAIHMDPASVHGGKFFFMRA